MKKAKVYLAKFPFAVEDNKIYPPEREKEIADCTNEAVRAQKFFVWKLLEYALLDAFGLNIKDVAFQKTNGKWSCSVCEFSLSHCKEVCAVALSKESIGVDIEANESARFLRLADKILTERERESLSGEELGRETGILWTKKEAEFKRSGKGAFTPRNIETADGKFVLRTVSEGGMDYFVSVAGFDGRETEFFIAEGFEA